MESQSTSAIVIGGSIAGLLSARVLSNYYDTVTIIERDTLPTEAEYRNGTPQAHHLHALLAKGQELLNNLFPNIEQDFEDQGASFMRWGLDTGTRLTTGWIDRYDVGISSHVLSRVTLEWIIRQRVDAIPNVTFMTRQQVNYLLATDNQSTVTGVNVTSRDDKTEQNLYADLVVDASGRGSKAPTWLQDLGYDAPQETIVNSYLGYATRWYQIPDDVTYSWVTILIQTIPKQGLNRGGGMFVVEGNRLVATVTGANKDYPPTDDPENFLAFAKSLASPIMYDIIKDLTPISPIYGYRRTENQLRHYEKLKRLPDGFIVIGDAVCGFNPVYGQGMTAAAIEATELDLLLRQTDVRRLGDFSHQFQKRVAKAVDGAWLMATSEDMRYPETDGATPNFIDRATHRYMDTMMQVMPHDHTLCTAFIKTMNLSEHPTSLFHPKYMMRVLRHKLLDRQALPVEQLPFHLITQPLSVGD